MLQTKKCNRKWLDIWNFKALIFHKFIILGYTLIIYNSFEQQTRFGSDPSRVNSVFCIIEYTVSSWPILLKKQKKIIIIKQKYLKKTKKPRI